MKAALINAFCVWCNLCVNVPWMQAGNVQKHGMESGKTNKGQNLNVGLFVEQCWSLLQMDTWKWDWTGGAVSWMDSLKNELRIAECRRGPVSGKRHMNYHVTEVALQQIRYQISDLFRFFLFMCFYWNICRVCVWGETILIRDIN